MLKTKFKVDFPDDQVVIDSKMDDEEVEEFNNINVFKANSSEQKLIKSLHDEINVLKKQLEQRVEPVLFYIIVQKRFILLYLKL